MKILREDTAMCGVDSTRYNGIACKGDYEPKKICGCSGVLYDAVYPEGAHLIKEPTKKRLTEL
jgi:hypothetical protein